VDNAAATLQPIGSDEKKDSGELTHNKPKAFTNGELRYDFSLVAPASGTVKIFGAGNSANKDNNSTGDRSSTATLSVTVNGTGSGTEPEPKGGCSTTAGAPLMLLGMAAASLLRRRRQS
jgi:MYXO-CTERM domain-containing protein